MTDKTQSQEDGEWKVQKATENIWKIQDILRNRGCYIQTIYAISNDAMRKRVFEKYGQGANIGEIIRQNSVDTFGAEENPVSDLQNSINCNSEYINGTSSRWQRNEPKPWCSTVGISRYSFIEDLLEHVKATKEQCQAIGNRTMNREQFEDLVLKALDNCPIRMSDRLGYSENPYLNSLRETVSELFRTKYHDRTSLGTQSIVKPYRVAELTEEEWEAKKAEILKPKEES